LNALPFKTLIGGPLTAAIQAQALAAKNTVDFIHDVGFQLVNGKNLVRTVSFNYAKFENGSFTNYTLTVPFILMLPIPYIELEEITIDLNVKLNSVDRTEHQTDFKTYAEVSGSFGWWSKVNFKAGFSYQSQNKYTGETKREYALNIHVEAGQAGMPKGTEKILDILESVIVEVPKDN